MKKTVLLLVGPASAFLTLLFCSCVTKTASPWNDFVKCANNDCVKETVAVKDAFLSDPAGMLENFRKAGEKGEDHFIGWLYLLRDSVLLNPNHSPTEDRISMQQAIVTAAKPHIENKDFGDLARSIVDEVETLAIASELEDGPFDYLPVTGTYLFQAPNNGGNGILKVSLIDLENIRFDLQVVGGPPARNQGIIEGRARSTEHYNYVFETTEFGGPCKLQFTFDAEAVEIKTLAGGPAECGFGNGVVADNVYRMTAFEDPFLPDADGKIVLNMQGDWVSATDPKSIISILHGKYVEVYDSKETGNFPYQYHTACPKECAPVAKGPCFTVTGQDVVCYMVVKADGKTLELSMIGGTGNTLVYNKL